MSEGRLGLFFDLGTTTLGGRLVDSEGTTLAEARMPNPQAVLGADIIRRLEAALKGEGERLQALLVLGIGELTGELLRSSGRNRREIAVAAAAGNSGISYLLRNLPVDPILFPPHRPKEKEGVYLDPADLSLDLPVPLYLFPLVSGYVGGDLVAFLYGLPDPLPGTLFVDIGTNGEMALFTGEHWHATSVAAGPAFEGGGIACGMALEKGAVKGVKRRGDSLKLKVEGGGAPRGICGSGLAEAVAAGVDGGLIDSRGGIVGPEAIGTNLARYVDEGVSGRSLRLYRDALVELRISQQDIRNFQLAKGAILAGVECLISRAGLEGEDLAEVLVTGAFGFSLGPEILKKVAMLPENVIDKVRFLPGGVVEGGCRFLFDAEAPGKVQNLADALKPFPLSGTPTFEKAFLKALDF